MQNSSKKRQSNHEYTKFQSFNKRISDFSTNSDVNSFTNLRINFIELLKKHRGIEKFYDWQLRCIKLASNSKKNLVYSLPTSGGKTLVAEVLMLKTLMIKNQSVIFVLPFVSIVQEKVRALEPFGMDLQFYVEEYAGAKGKYPPKSHRKPSVYVATIEKAHSLINSFIENKIMDRIGLLVVDEVHMIGDGSRRGATLELCMIKFMKAFPKSRIVAMSATLSNLDEMARFLSADLFVEDFRPVELKEYAKVDQHLFAIRQNQRFDEERFPLARTITANVDKETKKLDPDNVAGLVAEILPKMSCLIFCPTKRQCEALMNNLIRLIDKRLLMGGSENKEKEREEFLDSMKFDVIDISPSLLNGIRSGVAYHHSGLTQDERRIVEDGFLTGMISVICCTSTLAAGVNLPARRVIIRSPYIGADFITYSQYRQMTGRAGRAGFDVEGESIVILPSKDKDKFSKMLQGSCLKCCSSILTEDLKILGYFVLSCIFLNLAEKYDDIESILQRSFYNIQNPNSLSDSLNKTLRFLLEKKLLKQILNKENNIVYYKVTEFGQAVVKGNIDVSLADIIYKDLKNAEMMLNISSHLHLLYLVTPHDLVGAIAVDYNTYSRRYNALSTKDKSVTKLIGFDDIDLTKLIVGKYKKTENLHAIQRFYLTLIFHDLWNQLPVSVVSSTYDIERGKIQSLFQSAVAFSACLTHFVEEFSTDLWAFRQLLPEFTIRLSYCVSPELIPLMTINGVKKGRAVQLYQAGYDSVSKVAAANQNQIIQALGPVSRKAVNEIILSAQMIVKEKLESLQEEVKELVTGAPQEAKSIIDEINESLKQYEDFVQTKAIESTTDVSPVKLIKFEEPIGTSTPMKNFNSNKVESTELDDSICAFFSDVSTN